MGGIFGSSSSEQQNRPDPLTQQLNELKYNIFSDLNRSTGGLSTILGRFNQFALPSFSTQDYANNAASFAQQGGLSSQDWYNQALQGLNQYQGQAQTSQDLYNRNLGQLGNLNQANLGYINNTLAPQLLGSGQDYFRQILSPTLNNQYSLLGLGRSGANLEAQSKGAASIALPIAQQIAGLTGSQLGSYYGAANQNLQNNAAQQGAFGTQYLQNLYGLNQQYPNVDIGLRQAQLERLGQGLNFSDYSRQQSLAGLEPQLQGFLGAFTGSPYTPGGTTSTQNTGSLASVIGGLGGGLGTLAGGIGLLRKG